jgi:spore coat protein U-like protein
MFSKKQVTLVAAALASFAISGSVLAATAVSTMTVDATLTTGCEVTSTSAIHFGSFVALASTGNKTADSGTSFQVACSNSAAPNLYAVGTREMVNGANVLPFNLSLTAGAAADDLAAVTGTALSITQNGSLQNVTIYGRTLAANFKGLPSGDYTTTVAMTVAY